MKKLLNIISWLSSFRLYVIADPSDNSVTFSKGLFRRLKLTKYTVAPKAYVFCLPHAGKYAFCINPQLPKEDAPLAAVQFNAKYRTVGFESLVPTVQRIFFDYGLKVDKPCKLSVTPGRCKCEDGKKLNYYIIERPYV